MTDPRTNDLEPDDTIGTAADDYEIDGEFDLDRLYAETRQGSYRFRWAGRSWELPNLRDLPTGILEHVDRAEYGAADVVAVLENAFGHEQWSAMQAEHPLPIRAAEQLFNRWLKWSGADVGESSSSAASSNGTAGRSKRTSRSVASTSVRRSTAGRKNGPRRASSSA